MVIVFRSQQTNPPPTTVDLVDAAGRVITSASFTGSRVPFVGGCGGFQPPQVRVAAGAAFYAVSVGAIHRLAPDGTASQVASFPITSTQFLSFAVSPDGQRLIAILLSTPQLKSPIPQYGVDPFVGGTDWTLDLEEANTGGGTTKVLHRDFGHNFPSPGPTFIAGWDGAGPVATLNSYFCTQNVVQTLEYTGNPLIHLASAGNSPRHDRWLGLHAAGRASRRNGPLLCAVRRVVQRAHAHRRRALVTHGH